MFDLTSCPSRFLSLPGMQSKACARALATNGLLLLVLLCPFTVSAQSSSAESNKPVSEMSTEELAQFIKEQQQQLEAVKQARDAQKAKHAEVQEALIDRQEKLNQIVIELSKLCSERKELNPDDDEPCLPEDS